MSRIPLGSAAPEGIGAAFRRGNAGTAMPGPRILAGNTGISVPGWHVAGSLAYPASTPEEAVQYVSSSYCLTPGEIVRVIDATIARLGNKHITGESLSAGKWLK